MTRGKALLWALATGALLLVVMWAIPNPLTAVLKAPDDYTLKITLLEGQEAVGETFTIDDTSQLEQISHAVTKVECRFGGWYNAIAYREPIYTLWPTLKEQEVRSPRFTVDVDGYIYVDGRKYTTGGTAQELYELLASLPKE